jgi:hypothetical protein
VPLSNPIHTGITFPERPRGLIQFVSARLAAALALSVVLHGLGASLLEYEPAAFPEPEPLRAELKALPPPPLPQPAARPKDRPPPPRPPAPAAAMPAAPFSPPPPEVPPVPEPNEASTTAGFPDAEPYSDTEPVFALSEFESKGPRLPPKIDLVYTVLYGTIGLHVGQSSYRFTHENGRYAIVTVGEAEGLLALIYRGKLRASSYGRITELGLQPEEVALERGSPEKREAAKLNWQTRTVTFKDDSSAPLPLGTLDVLSFLLQFYFVPPTQAAVELPIVTPRRITSYRFERKGVERVNIALGDFDAEVWSRTAVDGSEAEALVWLAPQVGHVPIKIRVRDPQRGTGELRLSKILAETEEPKP